MDWGRPRSLRDPPVGFLSAKRLPFFQPARPAEKMVAERGGFEPPVVISYSRFPGVRLKPLSHLSVGGSIRTGEGSGQAHSPLAEDLSCVRSEVRQARAGSALILFSLISPQVREAVRSARRPGRDAQRPKARAYGFGAVHNIQSVASRCPSFEPRWAEPLARPFAGARKTWVS